MSIEKAIELLKKEYAKAQKQPYVKDPLAFSLYQTWKKVEQLTLNGNGGTNEI